VNLDFEVIVPYQRVNDMVVRCLTECLRLDYDDSRFRITFVSDEEEDTKSLKDRLPDEIHSRFDSNVRFLKSGPINPAAKRNLAMKDSPAKYFAFVDSDAYPDKDWLKAAAPVLSGDKVGAVGGPNHAPDDAVFLERVVISTVYMRMFVGGLYKAKGNEQSDIASSNLIVDRTAAEEVGYFDDSVDLCEDTIMCWKMRNRKWKLLYSNDIAVYHHRRPLFMPHLSRLYAMAKAKAQLLPEYPEHAKILYYAPSTFLNILVGLCGMALLGRPEPLICVLWAYIAAAWLDALTSGVREVGVFLLVPLCAILTHLSYGAGFLAGMLFPNRR